MKSAIRQKLKRAVAGTVLFCMVMQPMLAAAATVTPIKLATEPLFLGAKPIPKVMLTVSKDQQLFKKAYNDYSDLDPDKGDGIETTYKHTITYYGYFDSQKCYDYVNGAGPNGRFEPKSLADDKTGLCTGTWNGNFLNWLSMTRMDAVRKLLYGGTRSTDSDKMGNGDSQGTVLERAYLPPDAHAFAKYYNSPPGADPALQPPIDRLTPFTGIPNAPATTAATTDSFAIPAAGGIYPIKFNTGLNFSEGDQIRLASGTGSVTGVVTDITSSTVSLRIDILGVVAPGTTSTAWNVTNFSSTGISFCNVTQGATTGADQRSSTNTMPPLIRVAKGNFALWNANERTQCQWAEDRSNLQSGFTGGTRSNGNQAVLSGIDASAENPLRGTHALSTVAGLKGDYNARVRVCVDDPDLLGSEKCRSYGKAGSEVLKPVGLLQEYGEDERIHFGLLTGSYQKNINGGVLRKNVASFADEIDLNTGVFKNPDAYRPPGAPRATNSAATVPGIVNTLNYMRIYGYDYSGGGYLGASGDSCTYQLTNLAPGQCTSWGNPIAEAFFESLRYFAAQKPLYAYTATSVPGSKPSSSSKDNELGLPQADWVDPMNNTLYCAKMNVLVFNASVSTNEELLQKVKTTDINGTASVYELTNNVGTLEGGINGKQFFVGRVPATSASTTPYELCTPKQVEKLGDVVGICPEGPTLQGTYLVGGLAHFARTNPIRPPSSLNLKTPPVPVDDKTSLRVVSYGIQLATNTPELVITAPTPGSPRVVIQPIYRLHCMGGDGNANGGNCLAGGNDNRKDNDLFGGGSLVDMKFVSQSWDGNIARGKVYVNWEDSEQGGDYDQDMWGTLEWEFNVSAKTITVTTNAISASTLNPQGFGYTISGTTLDGPHFHSGIYGFTFPDAYAPKGVEDNGVKGCLNCRLVTEKISPSQTGPQSQVYALGSSGTAGSLKDPLWYLAKYGGFDDVNSNSALDGAEEWDQKKSDGVTAGADGIPDNYFLVTNPLGLEQALTAAFNKVTETSTATSVAANTTSLQVGSTVYSARFDSSDWSGNLKALPIDSKGNLGEDQWGNKGGAAAVLKDKSYLDRKIYTMWTDPADTSKYKKGTLFQWNSVSPDLQKLLNISPDTGLTDKRGQIRLDYLRGSDANEKNAIGFRKRPTGPLGDILNSNPAFVPEPRANILNTDYRDFKNKYAGRTQMVYVAANDGMLHGFEAVKGEELVAYVPSKTFPKLNQLTSPAYLNKHRSFVDGSPEVADACVGSDPKSCWKTVLVGALGAGGQGLYALDATDPSTFSSVNPLMWEFNDTDDPELGYITSQPVIRKMADGRWAAIVSGGYNNTEADGAASATGNAFVFIIFLAGPTGSSRKWVEGTDYVKINTKVGYATSAQGQPNGLARPLAADTDANGVVNFIYAGDLQGNLWKFDVSSASKGNWTLDSAKVSLFQATGPDGKAQPITAQAEGILHPTGQGFVITFGTGKYLESDDTKPPFTVQSYYGIWDKNDNKVINAQTTVKSRSQLLDQDLSKDDNTRIRTIATDKGVAKVPDWTTQLGWFMDFDTGGDNGGERAVFTPLLRGGRLIFTTLIPNADPCQFGGSSFLMVIDPTTGGPFDRPVIDTSGDGFLTSDDNLGKDYPVYASGLKSDVGITNTPRIVVRPPDASTGGNVIGIGDPRKPGAGMRQAFGIMCGSSGACRSPVIGLTSGTSRVSWREVMKD